MRYVFLGPPASGKGTQGRRLAGEKQLAYLSTGGLLRSEIAAGTEIGAQAKILLDRGEYVPDDLILPIVKKWCESHPGAWVLDGFPRTKTQAQRLIEMLNGAPLTKAIVLTVPYADLESRVLARVECPACHFASSRHASPVGSSCPKCKAHMKPRPDDDIENFKSRYRNFQDLTQPAIDWLEAEGLAISICGKGAPHKVFARIIDHL